MSRKSKIEIFVKIKTKDLHTSLVVRQIYNSAYQLDFDFLIKFRNLHMTNLIAKKQQNIYVFTFTTQNKMK